MEGSLRHQGGIISARLYQDLHALECIEIEHAYSCVSHGASNWRGTCWCFSPSTSSKNKILLSLEKAYSTCKLATNNWIRFDRILNICVYTLPMCAFTLWMCQFACNCNMTKNRVCVNVPHVIGGARSVRSVCVCVCVCLCVCVCVCVCVCTQELLLVQNSFAASLIQWSHDKNMLIKTYHEKSC